MLDRKKKKNVKINFIFFSIFPILSNFPILFSDHCDRVQCGRQSQCFFRNNSIFNIFYNTIALIKN